MLFNGWDNVDISYGDEGSGQDAIVLVHGHPFDRSMWTPQIAPLRTAGWRVITPDLRGYGASTVVAGHTPLYTFARDVAHLLDHLDIRAIVLGGISMGGQIALEFYRLFGTRVRALILADTFAEGETESGKQLRRTAAERLLSEGMGPYAEEVLPKMVAPVTIRTQPGVAEHVLTMMRDAPPVGAAAALRGRADRLDYTEMLDSVLIPTLVVVGSDDEFTPVEDAQRIHRRVRGSRLAIIPETGHLPNLESASAFNRELLDFLGSIPPLPR